VAVCARISDLKTVVHYTVFISSKYVVIVYMAAVYVTSHVVYMAANHTMAICNHVLSGFI